MALYKQSINPPPSTKKSKSIFQSFTSLPKRTRLVIGLTGISIALLGTFVSDKLEQKFPVKDGKELFDLDIDHQTEKKK
ncbi:hypothetical protein K502DRAFT_367105 [Neoconidiobolus thromboides FSU 785]|nr:hypothetical protein K502DRAFT_367105 [Neoconidiobolus thromboides FSU 785]